MFAAQLTMDPLRCAVIKSDRTQCDRLLGGVFDGQGIYCACCHWLVKQSDPAYQKRCNDFLHDSALSAIAGLMLDATGPARCSHRTQRSDACAKGIAYSS